MQSVSIELEPGFTVVGQCEPRMWRFYDPADDTYHSGRPVAYRTDENGVEWIKAHTDVSRTTGRQYELTVKWSPEHKEWVLVERKAI